MRYLVFERWTLLTVYGKREEIATKLVLELENECELIRLGETLLKNVELNRLYHSKISADMGEEAVLDTLYYTPKNVNANGEIIREYILRNPDVELKETKEEDDWI